MLKLLTWAYDLGVQQERVRIARELEIRAAHYDMYIQTAFEVLVDSKMSESRKDRLAKRTEVMKEVATIVKDILRPDIVEHDNGSVMFPVKELVKK